MQESWAKNDETCTAAGGVCQHRIAKVCDGTYPSFDICGGPPERQCCVIHRDNQGNNDCHLGNKLRLSYMVTSNCVLNFYDSSFVT